MVCPQCKNNKTVVFDSRRLSTYTRRRRHCLLCNYRFTTRESLASKPLSRSEQLAIKFHQLYEELAPSFGYKTREASAKPWSEVPENNKQLMISVCSRILKELDYRNKHTIRVGTRV